MTDFRRPASAPLIRILRWVPFAVALSICITVLLRRIAEPGHVLAAGVALVGCLVIASSVLLVLALLMEAHGREVGAVLTGRWTLGAELEEYLVSRRPVIRMRTFGAFLVTPRGIALAGIQTTEGLTWTWSEVIAIEEGPVNVATGVRELGIILTLKGQAGPDIVPIAVHPSCYALRSSAASRTRFVRRLQELRAAGLDEGLEAAA